MPQDAAIDVLFSDSSGDQLGVLGAEIEYNDALSRQWLANGILGHRMFAGQFSHSDVAVRDCFWAIYRKKQFRSVENDTLIPKGLTTPLDDGGSIVRTP